jgi:hypothetical protein
MTINISREASRGDLIIEVSEGRDKQGMAKIGLEFELLPRRLPLRLAQDRTKMLWH